MTATSDTLLSKAPADLVPADLEALLGATLAPRQYAVLPTWSRARVAAEAAGLANSTGGAILVGAEVDGAGAICGFTGGAAAMGAEIGLAVADLGAAAAHLLSAHVVEVDGGRVGIIRVAESPAPPVLVETDGAIYLRTPAGLERVLTRPQLDALVNKDRSLRERAETNLAAMVRRNEFGHFNYLTLAVTIAPRLASAGPYAWADAHRDELVSPTHSIAARWGLDARCVSASAGEIVVAGPDEVTGFLRVSRNGTVAAGEHLRRPPSAAFLPAAELAQRIRDMVDFAALPIRHGGRGPALAAVSFEGVRDLRLAVADGLSRPAARDTVTSLVPERYLEDGAEVELLLEDVLRAAGELFAVNLEAGTGAHAGKVPDSTEDPRTWHGLTRRTERRVSGARGHGSAR
jgi:hypothetical protein